MGQRDPLRAQLASSLIFVVTMLSPIADSKPIFCSLLRACEVSSPSQTCHKTLQKNLIDRPEASQTLLPDRTRDVPRHRQSFVESHCLDKAKIRRKMQGFNLQTR